MEEQNQNLEQDYKPVSKQERIEKKKNWLLMVGVVTMSLLIMGVIYLGLYSDKAIDVVINNTIQEQNVINSNIAEDGLVEYEYGEDWDIYIHPVLGLEFKYKKDWGEPKTKPSEYITNLKTVLDGINSDNSYYQSVAISFLNSGPSIRIFNDDYKGELYPNNRAYEYGPTDNFLSLKETENICDYRINFPNNPSGTGIVVEDYAECNSNIKTTLLKDTKNFNSIGTRYQYNLKHYGFKKLKNGYLDNLMASFLVGLTKQLENDDVSFDNFLNFELFQKGSKGPELTSREKYKQDKEDFIKFVSSIKVFEPKEKERRLLKVTEDDNTEIVIIKKYYNYLLTEELQEAYAMYLEKDISFEDYNQWYESVILINLRDFENIAIDTYKFYVDYQDDNKKPQVYRVTMRVVGSKINIISSEEITSDKVIFENLKVFTKTFRDYNYVILDNGIEEIEIDRAPNYSKGDGLSFSNLEFSSNGRYIKYMGYGWEWSKMRIYDTYKKEIVLDIGGTGEYGYTLDYKHFYACYSGGMSANRYINIYSLPSFDIIKTGEDLEIFNENNFSNIHCKIDLENNILNIEETGYRDYSNKDTLYKNVYKYNFFNQELD